LDASRLRIAPQLLAESVVLSVGGGIMGVLLASWTTDLFASFCLKSTGVELPPMTVDGTGSALRFWAELTDRARTLPGVLDAAYSGSLPLAAREGPENMKARVTLHGWELPAPGFIQAEYQDVSAGYFRTMGIPLRRGRTFEDSASDAYSVVINESFARVFWGNRDPAGKRIIVPGGRPYIVVGVMGDVRQYHLRSAPPKRQIYRSLWRSDVAALSKWPSQYLIVRISDDPAKITPLFRNLIKSTDPERPVVQTRTMRDVAYRSTAWDQMEMVVVAVFGITALLLSLVGVYAVVSHSVSRRRREIGIGIALGGEPGGIRRMVLRQGLTIVIAELGIGACVAPALLRLLSGQLFEVTTTAPPRWPGSLSCSRPRDWLRATCRSGARQRSMPLPCCGLNRQT
jgi:putative ABC transport system permease protein